MSAARSNRREVRNPILGLPAARAALAELPADQAEALRTVLLAIAADARGRADESWRKHKGPMAAYWKAASVYAGHIAKAIRAIPRQPSLFTNERNA
jgi:hypothetical protein